MVLVFGIFGEAEESIDAGRLPDFPEPFDGVIVTGQGSFEMKLNAVGVP
jgi:hypothetical protein